MKRAFLSLGLVLGLLAILPATEKLRIRFSFTAAVSQTPISGRIIVGFQPDLSKPVNNPDLFDPQPTFAWEVRDWKPGEDLVLDGSSAVSWMGDLDSLEGWFGVQAVLKTNRRSRQLDAPGNAATIRNHVFIEKGKMCRPLELIFVQPGRERKFTEQEFVKEAVVPSRLLGAFYGQPETIRATVILPPSYFQDGSRTYPGVYVFGGWGSLYSEGGADYTAKRYGMSGFGGEKIFVFVGHDCGSGYHVFCSSETNGPREESFFQELVPFIEKEYRVSRDPRSRFLMGQSSGAWAGLWLLIRHPEQFGGVYAGSPDPVDFTDFTGTDIYARNANMFVTRRGEKKFLIEKVSMEEFTGLDRLAGRGEQMYSFDAAFSPGDGHGQPLHLYDWKSGEVDPRVAGAWETHDLSRVVRRLDQKTAGLLDGKIHIFVAEHDPIGLDRPVRRFWKVLKGRGIAADIRFVPGHDHAVWNDEVRRAIHEDMDGRVAAANGKSR